RRLGRPASTSGLAHEPGPDPKPGYPPRDGTSDAGRAARACRGRRPRVLRGEPTAWPRSARLTARAAGPRLAWQHGDAEPGCRGDHAARDTDHPVAAERPGHAAAS